MGIGEQVKALRVSKGLQQAELANLLDVTQGFVSQIESDSFASMNFAIVAKLCAAFGLPLEHFAPTLAPGVRIIRSQTKFSKPRAASARPRSTGQKPKRRV